MLRTSGRGPVVASFCLMRWPILKKYPDMKIFQSILEQKLGSRFACQLGNSQRVRHDAFLRFNSDDRGIDPRNSILLLREAG